MTNFQVQDLIDRYVSVSFRVDKKAGALVKAHIGDDLTTDQLYILGYIHEEGKCTSSELADAFYVNKSAITAIINRLVDKGLIQRTRDENDRRVIYLTLTDVGKDLRQITEEKVHQLVECFITQFEETEIKNFIETYEKLAVILDNMCKEEMGE